jgi:hypothetical protein
VEFIVRFSLDGGHTSTYLSVRNRVEESHWQSRWQYVMTAAPRIVRTYRIGTVSRSRAADHDGLPLEFNYGAEVFGDLLDQQSARTIVER